MAKKKKQKQGKEIPVKDQVNVKEAEMEENTGVENEVEQENPETENADFQLGADDDSTKLKQELGELKNNHIRLMAEFDNFRKRTQKEKLTLINSASEDLMKALLPVLDDFDRTMIAIDKTDNLDSIRSGVKLVAGNFSRILEKKGLAPLNTAKGDDFNSELHEAITTVPAGDEAIGKIVDVIEPGYKLNDKVIRYAKVVVGE